MIFKVLVGNILTAAGLAAAGILLFLRTPLGQQAKAAYHATIKAQSGNTKPDVDYAKAASAIAKMQAAKPRRKTEQPVTWEGMEI